MWYYLYFQFLFIQLYAFIKGAKNIDDQWDFDKADEKPNPLEFYISQILHSKKKKTSFKVQTAHRKLGSTWLNCQFGIF